MWRIEGGGGIGGGTVATAGNLVFQVINDGRFRAVTADKGEILYEIKTGRTGMAPPITYEVDGKQYVAFQGGLGRPATTVGPTTQRWITRLLCLCSRWTGQPNCPNRPRRRHRTTGPLASPGERTLKVSL